MKLRTRIATALAVLVGTVGSVFIASPAMAAQSDCTNYLGTICMTENHDWSGRVWRQYPSQIVGCRSLIPDNFDNKASIAANLTSSSVGIYLYQYSNCTGRSVYVASGYIAKLWLVTPTSFDNTASAIRVVYY
jgi:Peptidase inhibitor family I36